MPTLTFSLAGSAIVNGSIPFTISDADVQKWVDYLVAIAPAATPPTPAQALTHWARGVVAGTVADVQAYNRARADVPIIVISS